MPVERIESAGTNQGFDGAPVDQAFVGAPTEIEQILERTAGLAHLEDRVHRLFAGSLDGAETVANRAAVDRREAVFGGIHVRPEDAQAVGDGVVVNDLHRVGDVHVRRQRRRHEGGAMVCLQPGGVVGDDGVGGGVRLVEAVLGELLHQVEKLHRQLFVVALLLRPFAHQVAVQGHLFGLLLAHRTPQQVGGAQRIAADDLRDLHHLFLIDDDPVGRFEADLQIVDVSSRSSAGPSCAG
jgi:hypothetical protein